MLAIATAKHAKNEANEDHFVGIEAAQDTLAIQVLLH